MEKKGIIMHDGFQCPACGNEMRARTESRRYDQMVNVVLEGIDVHHCDNCGEEEVVYRRFGQLNEAIAQMIAGEEARLGPGEIRFLRTYLGLTGAQLARTMGVAPETVSRWESESAGQSMGTVAERLLRVMVLHDVDVSALESMAVEDQTQGVQMRLHFRELDNRWASTSEPEPNQVSAQKLLSVNYTVETGYRGSVGSVGSFSGLPPADLEYADHCVEIVEGAGRYDEASAAA